MHTSFIKFTVMLSSLAFVNTAVAHPGHATSFAAGMAHPLFGLDHALAMLAVGLWAYQLGGRARLLVPTAFVTLMGLGGSLALMGVVLPAVELGISASVLLLGLLVAFAAHPSTGFAAAVAGTFAVFHGYAHGLEIPAFREQWSYVFGFMCATAILHLAGMILAAAVGRAHTIQRTVGMSIAAVGGWLVASVLA